MKSTLSIRNLRFIALSAAIFAVSCSDETTVFENPEDSLLQEIDPLKLEGSVIFDNVGVLDIYEDPLTSAKRYGTTGKDEQAGDYPLTLVAQVAPPSFEGGENLTATHVTLDEDYGYVTYNTVGQDYVGAIDVINISDPHDPKVTSRVYFSNTDLNSIVYDNGYVYVAGGIDAEKSATATANSMVAKIAVNSGVLNTNDITFGFQEGFNATDISIMNNTVFVTSGQDGFLVAYNKSDMSVLNEAAFTDLRSVAVNGNEIAILDASQGVSILDENLVVTKSIEINSDFGVDAKRTLDFSSETIVVAEGSKGAGVYHTASGSFLQYLPILTNPQNVEPGTIVTNAVAVNQDVLLMANGAAGLSLSEKKANNTEGFGVVELTGSINYVASKGDYIFAASGKSGFQIIKLNRPSQSLETACADLTSYNGSANYTVPVGEEQAFKGSKRFNSIDVDGSLLLCGSWTIMGHITVSENALFEMNGTLALGNRRNNRVGEKSKNQNILVKSGATLRIEGDLVIYGDLILEDGATLEFLGDSSVAAIWGTVEKADTAIVTGTFTDYYDTF